jgi:hypothetical protein
MPDPNDLSYFTDVLKRLDAVRDRAMNDQDNNLAKLATRAAEPIGILVGCLLTAGVDARSDSSSACG